MVIGGAGMTNELEPCPFCPDGGMPELWFGEYDAHIFCAKCGAHSKGSGSGHKDDMERAAINSWNTRYKRTCKMRHFDTVESRKGTRAKFTYLQCSDCGGTTIADMDMTPKAGGWIAYRVKPSFCLHCGAEVVE